MTTLTLVVQGVPTPWARPRKRGRGGYFSPHKETAWYKAILGEVCTAQPRVTLSGPVSLTVTFFMPRPKGLNPDAVWHLKRPDRSNLEKLVEDALQDAKVVTDDAQFCAGPLEKRYALPGQAPGAVITLLELPDPAYPREI